MNRLKFPGNGTLRKGSEIKLPKFLLVVLTREGLWP